MDVAELVVNIRVMASEAGSEMASIIGELKRFGEESTRVNAAAGTGMTALAAASGKAFTVVADAIRIGMHAGREYKEIMQSMGEGIQRDAPQMAAGLEGVQAALTGIVGAAEAMLGAESLWDALLPDIRSEDIKAAMSAISAGGTIAEKLLFGELSPEEAAQQATTQIGTLVGAITAYLQEFDFEGEAQMTQTLAESISRVNEVADPLYIRGYYEALTQTGDAATKAAQGFDWANASQKEATKQAKGLLLEYGNLKNRMGELEKNSKTLQAGQEALNKAKKDSSSLTKDDEKAMSALGKMVGYTGKNMDVLQEKTTAFGKTLEEQTAQGAADAQALSGELSNAAASANVKGEVQVDCANAVSELQGLITVAMAALKIIAALTGGSVAAPKGGGGKGKNDAEAAARAAEQKRKDAIRKDYDLIAHKRHMNEITLEMELSMIEKIRRAHKLNAEEIMEWEEKVYDLKKEIRARDAGSIDKTGDAIIDALEARYQAMLDAEVGRLDASREAWSTWRDESVAAIEDQIKALDELSKTEDREKQDQEELRKIAKLRQDIEFEQDEYNRMKLGQQLEQAISAREDRLRRQALDDQKEALREQITAIQDKAEAEISALDKTQTEIEKAYAEQMKSAALRAEAEKLLMANNQQEIIELIGEFAPDYDALGKTLGEKLLDGFKAKAGDVVKWFEDLNRTLAGIQETAAAEAIAAAGQLQSGYQQRQSTELSAPGETVVNQTVNFYEPVETAGDAARRIAQTNEELGALLYGGI